MDIIINPQRTCAARVTVVSVSACVCVCLSVCKYSGAYVRRENGTTYSAGNEGHNICGNFSKTAPLQRLGSWMAIASWWNREGVALRG